MASPIRFSRTGSAASSSRTPRDCRETGFCTGTGTTCRCISRRRTARFGTGISSAAPWRASPKSWTICRPWGSPRFISAPSLSPPPTTGTTPPTTKRSTPFWAPSRIFKSCAGRAGGGASALFWTACSTTPVRRVCTSTPPASTRPWGRPRVSAVPTPTGTPSTRGPRTTTPGGASRPCPLSGRRARATWTSSSTARTPLSATGSVWGPPAGGWTWPTNCRTGSSPKSGR